MTREYDLYKAMAQMMGKFDDLPPEQPFTVYVPEGIAKRAEAKGVDLKEFLWVNYNAHYVVDRFLKPIPYE